MGIAQQIRLLAETYETAAFLNGDPSWFMHQVSGRENQELMAFIASCFSYGARRQFMPKIQTLLDDSGGHISEWVKGREYTRLIADNDGCFYRLHTNSDARQLLDRLADCCERHGSLKALVAASATDRTTIAAIEALVKEFGGSIVPKSTQSSCKRLCMFLRWMVRSGSPVDLGLWADIIDRRTLIIPLDTHVMQQANRLHLISTRTASMRTARLLTAELARIFPGDPLKGDFALFGYGIHQQTDSPAH